MSSDLQMLRSIKKAMPQSCSSVGGLKISSGLLFFKNYPLLFLYLFFCISRLGPLFNDLIPYQFCDEAIFSDPTWEALSSHSFTYKEFKAGGLNILTVLLPLKIVYACMTLDKVDVLIAGRTIYLLLSGLTIFFLYRITFIITKKSSVAFYSALIFVLSPFVFSVTLMWYPDDLVFVFSSGFLCSILQAFDGKKKRDFIVATVFLAAAISTKYTGIVLVIPWMFLFGFDLYARRADDCVFNLKLISSQCLKLFFVFLLAFFVFNYSIVFCPENFLKHFIFNLKNYGPLTFERGYDGVIFYFVLSYITFLTPFLFFLPFIGAIKLFFMDKKLACVLLLFPLIYLHIIGLRGLVINRNVSILIPFIVPVFAIGLDCIADYLSGSFKKVKSVAVVLLPAVIYASIISSTNLKPDTRYILQNEIVKYIPEGEAVAVDEFCSGDSPALTAGFTTVKMNSSFNPPTYYLVNSYWASSAELSRMHNDKGLLQYIDQKYIHYESFNNARLYGKNTRNMLVPGYKIGGYEIIKIFFSNGPTYYLLKK